MDRRSVLWVAFGSSVLELLDLHTDGGEIIATSVVIGAFAGREHGTHYILRVGLDWTFKSLRLERTNGAKLELSLSDGHWSSDGRPLDHLAGCEDIDLSGSPFTNTLPIRRLAWEIGQSR